MPGLVVIHPIGLGGLQTIHEKDVLVLRQHIDCGVAVLLGLDVDFRHVLEGGVSEVAVVVRFGGELSDWCAVWWANVRALTEIVPRDNLDEIGHDFEQVHPPIHPHSVVLGIEPVVRHQKSEVVWCDSSHPRLVRGTPGGKVLVNGLLGQHFIDMLADRWVGRVYLSEVAEVGVIWWDCDGGFY